MTIEYLEKGIVFEQRNSRVFLFGTVGILAYYVCPSPSASNITDFPRLNVPLNVSFIIIIIIINSITFPFTAVLNVLGILAGQKESNTSKLCRHPAGLISGNRCSKWITSSVQPSFILRMILRLLEVDDQEVYRVAVNFHDCALRGVLVCESVHLMLVTLKRIIAIKFTLHYFCFVKKENLEIAVTVSWLLPTSSNSKVSKYITCIDFDFSNVLVALTFEFRRCSFYFNFLFVNV